MAPTLPPSFLRLVQNAPATRPLGAEDFSASSWQRTLFARQNPALLIVMDIQRASETDFLTVLVGSQARFVVDLRVVPRFDIGGMNRKLIFALFEQTGTQYLDIAGRLGVKISRDARLNPPLLLRHLQKFALNPPLDGPIVFLVDAVQFEDTYVNSLADALSVLRPNGWEILRLPLSVPAKEAASDNQALRRIVFISHANPEDNEFTIWLSAKLACAGYEVWSDIANLLGGEEFWNDIEEAIRRHSAKVVAVLSRRAQIKSGVLDEINCAVSVERALSMECFVIPVRIDDLPFAQIRANLARKNVIDFCSNWAGGLSQLLSLFERDQVPRLQTRGAEEVAAWSRKHLVTGTHVQNTPERYHRIGFQYENFLPTLECTDEPPLPFRHYI